MLLAIFCFIRTDSNFTQTFATPPRSSTTLLGSLQNLYSVVAIPPSHLVCTHIVPMNFYFEASKILDRLDAKQGSIKGLIATLPEKSRKRSAALFIETLKCEASFVHLPSE